MAVHGNHLADLACCPLLFDQLPDFPVAAIPRGLIVDDYVDATALRSPLDPMGVPHADRERFLHHHVDLPARASLHHRRVIVRVGECRDGLGLGVIEHCPEVGE